MALALYKSMESSENRVNLTDLCVALNRDDYVEKAVRFGLDQVKHICIVSIDFAWT